jgi:phage shock protein C
MKRLYQSKAKKISGVCGGIAEYFEIDAALVRLAWIVLTVMTGIVPGIIGYIAAALVIPHELEPKEGV